MWLRIVAGAGALALAAFLIWVYGNARENAGELSERVKWQAASAVSARRIADLELQLANSVNEAQAAHIERTIRMEPVIVRSTNTIREIRTDPALAAICLAPERVRGIEGDAAALAGVAKSATGNADPVQQDAP
jgi:hypothetical protein